MPTVRYINNSASLLIKRDDFNNQDYSGIEIVFYEELRLYQKGEDGYLKEIIKVKRDGK